MKSLLLILSACLLAGLLFGVNAWQMMIRMPGSHELRPEPADAQLAGRLRKHVEVLAGTIGERNLGRPEALLAAQRYIRTELLKLGYKPELQPMVVNGQPCANIEVVIPGRSEQTLVVGAHYDSAPGSPGANDNASGTAALLELAREFYGYKGTMGVRLVWFTNEEPPYFRTGGMGSRVYAATLRKRGVKVFGMLSLETLGYYSDQAGSQHYPFPFSLFYPSTGNFVAFVANLDSRSWLDMMLGSFRRIGLMPSEGVATYESIDGIGWSDHESFWKEGYMAVMVTDTAVFRYPYYHTAQDTPDKVDYPRLALTTSGLYRALAAWQD